MDGSTNLSSILDDAPQEQAQAAPDTQQHDVPEQPQAEQQGESGEQQPSAPEETPEQKKERGYLATIKAERDKRQELERRLQAMQPPAQPVQQAAQPQNGEPTRDQFQSDAEYQRALIRHELKQELEQKEQQQRDQQYVQRLQQTANESVEKGKAKYADFDTVINDGLAPFLTPQFHQALLMTETSHDLAYHLGKDPAEAQRIASLPPLLMVRELTRLEARIAAQAVPSKPSIPQTITQTRDSRGRFQEQAAGEGPTPLDAILR